MRTRNFLNPLSRVEIFEYDMNPDSYRVAMYDFGVREDIGVSLERTGTHGREPLPWVPSSTPYMGWVCCWFSPSRREVFLQVLWFSPLLKNQHLQIPIRPGIRQTKNHYVDVLPPNRYLFYLGVHALLNLNPIFSHPKNIKRDWVRVCYASGIAWTLNQDIFYPVTSQDRAQFFTVNIRDGAERKLSLLHFLYFSFKSSNVCVVKPWLLSTSIVAMRLDILTFFMSDGRIERSKQVKLAN